MQFALCRIIGNEIPYRHSEDQNIKSLSFILEHEVDFPGVSKIFVLNRIIDPNQQKTLVEMIESYGYDVFSIPFVRSEYDSCNSTTGRKYYVTNVNPARNKTLQRYLPQYDYVMPFDGNCFLRTDGWEGLFSIIAANPLDAYFFCPMWRVLPEDDVLEGLPRVRECFRIEDLEVIASSEPQLVFTPQSDQFFDEKLIYGNFDKVELLWRLGISGIWDRWSKRTRQKALWRKSEWFGTIKRGGFVCRLPSGVNEADSNNRTRGNLRNRGLETLVESLG